MHLLTVEAFELYTQHLAAKGVLAFHISNDNVDLAPLVFRLVDEFEMHAAKIVNREFPSTVQSGSVWVIASRSASYIGDLPRLLAHRRTALNLKPNELNAYQPSPPIVAEAPRWTDDYSDLLSVLRPRFLAPRQSFSHQLRMPRQLLADSKCRSTTQFDRSQGFRCVDG